ncbi:hypothetical protein [Allokutzneria sp. NRRL B-24872]|uniref:hypothetical protein n=1 Tax=Allokutzneria sp. NRRL B-24872 TaxID=1137961 RepID=UPI000A3D0EA1|nr:hypothetical protein [Allokutzneria sp. NRRL B-24872]
MKTSMRKSLAILPVVGALITMGGGTAFADSATTGAEPTVRQMANCDPIWRLSDRAGGKCYDVAFRVGVRCESTHGAWQVFYSDWTQKGNSAEAKCPATWVAKSADYDLPD